MYEAENSLSVESCKQLPPEIVRRFFEIDRSAFKRSLLPWGEHCTECVWPSCYDTCGLYTPRNDGGCRLFSDGMVRVSHEAGLDPYLLKIKFKPWGKLWTVGSLMLHTSSAARRFEKLNILWGSFASKTRMPRRVIQKLSYWRRNHAENSMYRKLREKPDYFIMECYNGNQMEVSLTFAIRLRNNQDLPFYQKKIALSNGFHRVAIPYDEIADVIRLDKPFEVEIKPNNQQVICLYFGLMDFVKVLDSNIFNILKDSEQEKKTKQEIVKEKICKCIVWDLDNTLWDGILIEDGPEKIRLKDSVVDIIKETDRRGILHSIASKNNSDDVMNVLDKLKLSEYFLYPQVHWGPKSQSIPKIAQLLNIGIDSLMFVDDQPFEREEVKTNYPDVMIIDAKDAATIVDLESCKLPITEESRTRRQMYREQEQRDIVLASYEGDYIKFLRDCQIRLMLSKLSDENIERVYELAQRTNQMNYSGNRYSKTELAEIRANDALKTYVMRCEDKFGSYGIIGFAVLDVREPRLLDLMFSCRVQGKKVEHAFLVHLLKEYVGSQNRNFHANYRRTKKNEPAGKVFEDLKFVKEHEREGVTSLVFEKENDIMDYEIVKIVEEH